MTVKDGHFVSGSCWIQGHLLGGQGYMSKDTEILGQDKVMSKDGHLQVKVE